MNFTSATICRGNCGDRSDLGANLEHRSPMLSRPQPDAALYSLATLPRRDTGNGIKADANGPRPRTRAGDGLSRVTRTSEGPTGSSATARADYLLAPAGRFSLSEPDGNAVIPAATYAGPAVVGVESDGSRVLEFHFGGVGARVANAEAGRPCSRGAGAPISFESGGVESRHARKTDVRSGDLIARSWMPWWVVKIHCDRLCRKRGSRSSARPALISCPVSRATGRRDGHSLLTQGSSDVERFAHNEEVAASKPPLHPTLSSEPARALAPAAAGLREARKAGSLGFHLQLRPTRSR